MAFGALSRRKSPSESNLLKTASRLTALRRTNEPPLYIKSTHSERILSMDGVEVRALANSWTSVNDRHGKVSIFFYNFLTKVCI